MEFSPASQNGIMPPDQLYTRLTPHLMVATSSSAYWSAGLTVKVINTAPYPKTIPVSIQSQFTPTGSTSSSTVTVGEGYFDGATATIFLTNLGTGTNLLSAHWPGESRYQGFDYTMTTAINVLPGVPLSGGLKLSVSPTNYYGEPVNLTLTSYNTPNLNGTTATIYSNQYQIVSLSTGTQTTLYKVNGFNWGTFMATNGVWVNNATDPLPNVQQTVYRVFNAPYTGNYSLKYSYDNIFNWIVDGTTISTATAYFDQYSPATVVVPLTQGQHSFKFDITNGPGSSWNTNPGGFGAVVANTTGTSIWNIKDHLDPAQENYQVAVSSTASIVTFVNNTATYSTQYLSTGTVSYYATWPGRVLSDNRYYITTNSNTTSTQVIKHTLTAPITLTASNGYAGEPINITLTTTSTISLTGSTATIYANGVTATNLTFTGNTATGTITIASTGSYVISGQWLGGRLSDNKYYNSKTSTTVTSVISRHTLNSLVLLASTSSPIINTVPYVFTANAGTSTSVTGIVSFRETATELGTSTFINNVATLTLPAGYFTTGTHSINAYYYGTTNVPSWNSTASNTLTITVKMPEPTVTVLTMYTGTYSLSTSTNGYAGLVSVSSTGKYPLTNTVQIKDDNNIILGTGTLTTATLDAFASQTTLLLNFNNEYNPGNQAPFISGYFESGGVGHYNSYFPNLINQNYYVYTQYSVPSGDPTKHAPQMPAGLFGLGLSAGTPKSYVDGNNVPQFYDTTLPFGFAGGQYRLGTLVDGIEELYDIVNFGAGPFTIECWVKTNFVNNSYPSNQYYDYTNDEHVFFQGGDTTIGAWLTMQLYTGLYQGTEGSPIPPVTNGALHFKLRTVNGIVMDYNTAVGFATDWAHVALVGNSNNIKLYLNGQLVSTVNGTYNFVAGNPNSPNFGHTSIRPPMGDGFPGVFTMDELRVTNAARYTSNFTPVKLPAYDLTLNGNPQAIVSWNPTGLESTGTRTISATYNWNGNDHYNKVSSTSTSIIIRS